MFKADEEILNAEDISEKLDIPYSFMRRILQTLSREDILKTHRGRGGGFSLEKKPEEITVMSLVNIFQEGMDMTRCIFKDNICPEIESCVLRREVKDIEKNIKEKLGRLTVRDLI